MQVLKIRLNKVISQAWCLSSIGIMSDDYLRRHRKRFLWLCWKIYWLDSQFWPTLLKLSLLFFNFYDLIKRKKTILKQHNMLSIALNRLLGLYVRLQFVCNFIYWRLSWVLLAVNQVKWVWRLLSTISVKREMIKVNKPSVSWTVKQSSQTI